MPQLKLFFIVSSFLFLAACSGGSGSNNDDSVLTGQFVDSAVSGIRYETDTRSGITDSEGRFTYLAGERVRFYIGELMLGEAQSAATVSVFDLVEGINPVVGGALEKAIWNWRRGPGFSTVINIAILLQTLDDDGNPDNGIAISSEVAALFNPGSIDFNQHWQEFPLDRGFRKVLHEAKASALLDAGRQIRKPWAAMAHLYASLGIDSRLPALTSERIERPSAPGSDIFNATYEFDTAGRLIRQQSPRIGPVGPLPQMQILTFAYDAEDNLVSNAYDFEGDGIADGRTEYSYDADGNLVRLEFYWDDNLLHSITTITYDMYGNETSRQYDYDADGTPDSFDTYTYDSNGNQIRAEYDSDGDGSPDVFNSYTYDAEDNLIRQEYDYGAEGILDAIYSYTYDARGNLLREETDYDGDGSPDYRYSYAFDDQDNLTREEYDSGADGILDGIFSYTYDADGNLIREEYEYNREIVDTYVHTYDADGIQIRGERYYQGNDGTTPDEIYIPTYDANTSGWWSIFNRGALLFL